MSTSWWIQDAGSNSIRTYGYDIDSAAGWENFMARVRGENDRTPGRPGSRYVEKVHPDGEFSLIVVVFPVDPITGQQTLSPEKHIKDNLDELFALLDGQVDIRKQVDADPVRQAIAEVSDSFPVGEYRGTPNTRTFLMDFVIPSVFWRERPEVTGAAATSVDPGGNRPVYDAVYTLNGTDVSVTNNLNGESFTVAGASVNLKVDCAAGTVKQGATDRQEDFSAVSSRWMTLEPDVDNALVVAGTGGPSCLVDYYPKWAS